MKRIAFIVASLLICTISFAQTQASQEEIALAQRIYQAQEQGDEAAFQAAQKDYADYLLSKKDWGKYYNLWVNQVVFHVNNKHFYQAFTEIQKMTDDIKERKQTKYLYVAYQALGLYYVNRGNYEQGEAYFKKALEQVDTVSNQLAAANLYISLAQAQSYTNPAQAMKQLDRLPSLEGNPTTESGVLAYRCIIAFEMNDLKAFKKYYAKYDSIRQNFPEPFNEINYENVMVYHHMVEGHTDQALAWCDSLDSDIEAAELRTKVYEHARLWEKAYYEIERKDSLNRRVENEVLADNIASLSQTIDSLEEKERKAKNIRQQLIFVGVLAVFIISLLIGILLYRRRNHRLLKHQYAMVKEAQEQTANVLSIRKAFVKSMWGRLKSPVQLLINYARVFNNPDFRLKLEERPKAYHDIVESAKQISSLIEPVIESMTHENTAISEQQKNVCQDALRSPLSSLIGMAEILAEDKDHHIPEDEYLKMREVVSNNAYMVSVSTQELLYFSITADGQKVEKKDYIGLNEGARTVLHSYDFRNRKLGFKFTSDVGDDVHIHTYSEHLNLLLTCLLRNSDRFAAYGKVEVCCQAADDGTYSISVSNEGDKIPEGCDEEQIFMPFIRVSPSSHGLGIRLALARQLALSMDYELHIDMTYENGVRMILSGMK